ncbi:hypothetical protein SH1V18_03380 [Vallitalea longa]|uniref:Uncharacterized protein n=1 Tax=Vallitalea longa TaxID=2936439 RepID=A0A9W6DDZ7_9FIRM|nr:hypothetical protein [Vallitalea longa]GKX27858.1 hypothetical protein SH1V18_03380 [Vallitalea longa]
MHIPYDLGYKEDEQQTVNNYFYSFSNTYDVKKLMENYNVAQRNKEYAQNLIKNIEQYQMDLYNRCQEIQQTIFEKIIYFERYTYWYDNKVNFDLLIISNPVGKDIKNKYYKTIEKYKFSGRERHLAIRKYKELCNLYPNMKTVKKGFDTT